MIFPVKSQREQLKSLDEQSSDRCSFYLPNVVKIIKSCIIDLLMWEFIDCLSSTYEPRFLTTDDFIITEFPTVIEEILTLDNCCRVPMIRNSVFSSLSCSIHERMSSMKLCMVVIASC